MQTTRTIIFLHATAFRALAYIGSELSCPAHSSDRNSPADQSQEDERGRRQLDCRPDRQSGRQRRVASRETRENIATYVRHRTEWTCAVSHDVRGCSYSSSLNGHLQHPAWNGNPVPGLFLWRSTAVPAIGPDPGWRRQAITPPRNSASCAFQARPARRRACR